MAKALHLDGFWNSHLDHECAVHKTGRDSVIYFSKTIGKPVGLQLVSHHLWRQEWILSQLDVLEDAHKALLTQLSQLIASHPYTPIIESLPLKSPIWTATLIGVIGNIDRFHNYGQFRAYVGWFPKIKQSGTSINSSHLAPDGVRLARNVFGQMALTLMTPNVRETPFRIYYERLLARGMKPITAIGNVSGKLASVLYSCLKTKTPYDERKHRKQLGLPVEDDVSQKTSAEIIEAQIDAPDMLDIASGFPTML